MYDVEHFERESLRPASTDFDNVVRGYCYCRVSSASQRDDLQRQVAFMQERFPNHLIITDIASGLNFKRKGLQTLLELAFQGVVKEIAVAHRDRFCRFSYDLLEWIFRRHSVPILVLDQSSSGPEGELATDLLSVVHVFSCQINGKRKYRKKSKGDKGADDREEDPPVSFEQGQKDDPRLVRCRKEDVQPGAGHSQRGDNSTDEL